MGFYSLQNFQAMMSKWEPYQFSYHALSLSIKYSRISGLSKVPKYLGLGWNIRVNLNFSILNRNNTIAEMQNSKRKVTYILVLIFMLDLIWVHQYLLLSIEVKYKTNHLTAYFYLDFIHISSKKSGWNQDEIEIKLKNLFYPYFIQIVSKPQLIQILL